MPGGTSVILSIAGGVLDSCFFKASFSQATGVADSTGRAILSGGIAGMGQREIEIQFRRLEDDVCLAHLCEGGLQTPIGFTLLIGPGAVTGSKVNRTQESLEEFRATVRVSAVIQGIDADPDVADSPGFRRCYRKREENEISGRNVGAGNVITILRSISGFRRDFPFTEKRRSADGCGGAGGGRRGDGCRGCGCRGYGRRGGDGACAAAGDADISAVRMPFTSWLMIHVS